MKKVINITLGSIVFAIEQEAYEILASYLESIKHNIADNDDAAEIVADIERAIAEKFLARKRSEKVAVTSEDVSVVTTEMGSPADFSESDVKVGGESDQDEAQATTPPVAPESETKKRLYRDTDDAIIAGVASGLARYFDIDPVIVRVLFIVAVFFNGLGILAYIVLWLVVPAAETTAQKYAMRGERVTVEQITERVKRKIGEVDTDALKDGAKSTWGGLRPVLVKFFEVIGILVKASLSVLRYVVGFAFLIGGALSVAGMVSVYSIVLLSDRVLLPADAQVAVDTMLSSALGIVAISASFIMMFVPFLVLILAGGSMVAKRNMFTVSKSITLAVVWIVAVVLAGTTSVLQLEKVMSIIDPEGFEHGSYELPIDSDYDPAEPDTAPVPPVEQDVPSAPPASDPIDLPVVQ